MDEYVNPEPPPEITQIKTEDLIGDTLFSKPWLCDLLLKLIKNLDESDPDESKSGQDGVPIKELDSNIEKDLCDLWDMSVEKDVCLILDELNSVEIFEGYITKFYQIYPRAIEILIGILVNMATMVPNIKSKLAKNTSFIQYLFFKILAQMADVQSVIQTLNLFTLFLAEEGTKMVFIAFLNEKLEASTDASSSSNWETISENYMFILDQSLNPVLLDSAVNFLLSLLDSDDESLMSVTVSEHLVEAICNAAMTRLKLERVQKTFNHSNFTNKTDDKSSLGRNLFIDQTPTPSASRIGDTAFAPIYTAQYSEEEISAIDTLLNKYLLCLQTMSTCEQGVEALFLKFESTKELFNEYLDRCLVTLNDWEIRTAQSLKASVGDDSMQNLLCLVSILNCVFLNQPDELLHMSGSLVEFLIKLVSFCKQYLKMFKELQKTRDRDSLVVMASGNYELFKANLKDLFECICSQKPHESYHLKRLLGMVNSCKTMLE